MGYNAIYKNAGQESLSAVQNIASCEGQGMTFDKAKFDALPAAGRAAVRALRPHAAGTSCESWFDMMGAEPDADAGSPPADAGGAPLNVSAPGKTWIGHNEGVRLDHYDDSNGHCTVGIGHLVHKGNCTAAELAAPKITEAAAFALFDADIKPREKFVNDQKLTLTQTEFEAIVDLAFQSWPGGDFSKKVKAGDKAGAAAILGDETKYPGRGARRKILYLEGRYVDRGEK